MNTRPQGVTAIDNVVAELGVQQQRKRLGRPPKIRQQLPAQNDHLAVDMNVQTTTDNNKISTTSLIDTSANECRRSSRKKIIKFDVREVLNKNRKSHKVQIEARIDSNVIYANPSELSHQNSYLDKSDDESSRNSTFELNTTAPPIVTVEPAKRGRPRLSLPNKVTTVTTVPTVKRGRGRPPKVRPAEPITTTTNTTTKTTNATFSLKPTIAKIPTPTPVTVLLKKLNLSHGQTFKVSGDNYNVENKVLEQAESPIRVATNEGEQHAVHNDEVEEEEDNIIFELSSASSSSSYSPPPTPSSTSSKNDIQHKFAAVSMLDNEESEDPDFIVAAVEEVEVEPNENDKEISFELINEESHTISDNSVILMLDSKSSPETFNSMDLMVTQESVDTQEHFNTENDSNACHSEDVRLIDESVNSTMDGDSSIWEETQTTLEDMIIESDSLIEVIVEDEETEDHENTTENLTEVVYEEIPNGKEKEVLHEVPNLQDIEKEIIISEIEDDDTIEMGDNTENIEITDNAVIVEDQIESLPSENDESVKKYEENSIESIIYHEDVKEREQEEDEELRKNESKASEECAINEQEVETKLQDESYDIEMDFEAQIKLNHIQKPTENRNAEENFNESTNTILNGGNTKDELVKESMDEVVVEPNNGQFEQEQEEVAKNDIEELLVESNNGHFNDEKQQEEEVAKNNINELVVESNNGELKQEQEQDDVAMKNNEELKVKENNCQLKEQEEVAMNNIEELKVDENNCQLKEELEDVAMKDIEELQVKENNSLLEEEQEEVAMKNIEELKVKENNSLLEEEQEEVAKKSIDELKMELENGQFKPEIIDRVAVELDNDQTKQEQREVEKKNFDELPVVENDGQLKQEITESLVKATENISLENEQVLLATKCENEVIENAAAAMLRKTNCHKNSPSPNSVQRKRIEKRYEYVPEAARPKTMEEIFAEIAAQSSKVILEMAAVTKDDEPAAAAEIEEEQQIERKSSKIHELEQKLSTEEDTRLSKSHNTIEIENTAETNSAQKKRGRKPKQKLVKENSTESVTKMIVTPEQVVIPTVAIETTKKERRKSRWDETPAAVTAEIDKNQRQIDLKAAFQAALSEVAKKTTENENLTKDNYKLDLNDKTLPLMLYKSMSAKLVKDHPESETAHKSQEEKLISNPEKQTAADTLSDIEKFIADGVNLLKNDDKIMHELTNSPKAAELTEKNTAMICQVDTQLEVSVNEQLYETPADTPLVTPTATPPPKSPQLNLSYGATLESQGDDSAALRRSHRIKQITKAPKALVGRGLVREKERFALKSDMETKTYSLDDHLLDLAEVEAKNAKFLKEMEERLSNFQVIKENEYKCERIISKEARKMICDCFLTREEESRGELGCGEDCLNRLLMIECGPNCNVKERCTNKRFQKYLCSPCRVFRTEKKGFGIMADIQILPGEFIMEYVGEVIDDDEFERRRTAYSKEKNRHYYFMALRSDAIIDATIKGNISRFINHSCDPNAETQKWTINGELRIGFFSRKSIMPGEEITFDYQYQRYGREAQRCYCESANCRGWIGEEPDSDECEQPDEDSDEDNLTAGLLADDDEQTDEGESEDPAEVQRKLEYAAAAAKLMPLSDDVTKSERQKKKTDKLDDEDPTIKFRKLLSKISARVNNKQKTERRGRGRPRKTHKLNDKRQSPNKSRFIEDPDIEDEINFLRDCGLKNQSDTLSLSRLMVRAKLPQTRLNLLEVLRQGDEPCRRLFLDYHGLRLLHGWMSEDAKNMQIRLALLKTLMRLPIVNKTVLKDSKVLQTVQNWSTMSTNSLENNCSPSDDSSKESTLASETTTALAAETAESVNELQKSVQQLALKLCNIWDNLPEMFRIPKRERIEQMKEHEREADRQYEADLAVADKVVDKEHKDTEKHEDEHELQRDRFRRDLNRYNKRPYSNRDAYIPNPFRRRSGYDSDDTRHLSKEKRREIFAARVAREEAEKSKAEKRREFEIKCRFFGLHRRRTHPEDVPFCVNTTTGQWYAVNRRPIPTPLNYIHAPPRPKIKSTDPNDYSLPVEALRLPKEWRFAINNRGWLYYYHVKYRRSQWHPPTAAQLADCRYEYADNDSLAESSDDEEMLKSLEDETQFRKFMEKKIQDRKQKRRQHLVTETPISPRRDEDRLYNQQEVRKYKENKEKVRKRKEEIRRKKVESTKQPNNKNAEEESEMASKSKSKHNDTKQPAALPIQEYLLSSDEEMESEILSNNSLLSKIVEGDKIVDELDGLLSSRRTLKRTFDLVDDSDRNNVGFETSNQLVKMERDKELASNGKIKFKHKDKDNERYEQHKKRKLEKLEKKDKERVKEIEKDKSKRISTSNGTPNNMKDLEAAQRKAKEKFRCEIAGVIVHYLKPYLKSTCTCARITSDEDFNHLARKLTHFVMIKELKYCDSVGQTLVFTESVKNKSKEFIRKYMSKYGETYKKPDNDPEFRDIPFTMKQNHDNKTDTNSQPPQPPHPDQH